MNCSHCGSQAGKARANELSLAEAFSVADQLLELGCTQISFIGGEVFLYNGWEKVVKYLTSRGVIANIITNGYLFGDKQVDEVKSSGIANVAISIDGMESNHNRIRNNPKSFQHILQTIKRLNEENIPIGVNTTLLDSNISDLEAMYCFLVENNVKIWQLQLANPMGNLKSYDQLPISISNIKTIPPFIKQKREDNKIKIYTGDNIGYYDLNESSIRGPMGKVNYWPGCQAGLTVIGIDSIGNVKGCESLYDDLFIEGNIRNESLRNIWLKKGNFAYNRNFDSSLLTGKCKHCDMGSYCRAGCRGACFFTNGQYYENAYCIYAED